MKFLVTGACGYIGSHTLVDLIENGYEVVSIDNFLNSEPSVLDHIHAITGKKIQNYPIDLCDFEATKDVFKNEGDIAGVIHFAALKYVDESVREPLAYYQNNLNSLINVLKCCELFHVGHFVFSSSCSVYGNASKLPVDESCPLATPESPYANTKVMGEQIIQDFVQTTNVKASLLRYFNPAGAHPSGLLGENAKREAPNLVPRITGTLLGKFDSFTISGSDYPTRDGTCIRDYIHVSDIAHAHTLGLVWLLKQKNPSLCEVFNLGTGEGVSVLELVKAFEQANDLNLNYNLGPRRAGDVVQIYADNRKATEVLGWKIKYSLQDMMKSAWDWEKKRA